MKESFSLRIAMDFCYISTYNFPSANNGSDRGLLEYIWLEAARRGVL